MGRRKIDPMLLIIIGGAIILSLIIGMAVRYFVSRSNEPSAGSESGNAAAVVDGESLLEGEIPSYTDMRKQEIMTYPIAAEIEYDGVRYDVYKGGGSVFYYNTIEDSFTYGYNSMLADGDLWVYPQPGKAVSITESPSYFGAAWLHDDATLSGMLGWLEENGSLVLRARSASFMEWVYRYPDGSFCRMVVTDKYIVFSDLLFEYVFDIKSF